MLFVTINEVFLDYKVYFFRKYICYDELYDKVELGTLKGRLLLLSLA